MKIYFGILKKEVRFSEAEKYMRSAGIRVIRYYPKLRLVRFETEKKPDEWFLHFFDSMEEERDDFVPL